MASTSVDVISEAFLRYLESKAVITWKQISVIKGHRSPNRQLALFKSIVSQKDVVGFEAFCQCLLEYGKQGRRVESIGIKVPGEATFADLADHDNGSVDRVTISRRSSASLPTLTPDRRPRTANARLRAQSSSRAVREPRTRQSFVIKGIAYEWNQTNQTEQLQEENNKLLAIVKENLASMQRSIREKDSLILDLEHHIRDKELEITRLSQDNVAAEARYQQLKEEYGCLQTDHDREPRGEGPDTDTSNTAPNQTSNAIGDENITDELYLSVMAMAKEIPGLLELQQKENEIRIKQEQQRNVIANSKLDVDELRTKELGNPEDESLRQKREEAEVVLRKETQKMSEIAQEMSEQSEQLGTMMRDLTNTQVSTLTSAGQLLRHQDSEYQ